MTVVSSRKLAGHPVGGKLWMMIAYAVIKGLIIGSGTLAVIESAGLSTFSKALILAALSGFIGFAGVVTAALISTRATAEIHELAHRNHELAELNARMLEDLKSYEGLTKRRGDPTTDPDPT